MRLQRYDRNTLELKLDSALTPEGYIRCDAVTTKAGIFLYRNDDGSIRRELRHPREVFKADSLATMRNIPVVNTHQGGLVNAKTTRARQIGMTGEAVRVDGMKVVCPVSITTEDGVEAVKSGRRQVSLGYEADMVEAEPGATYDGEPYDCEQTNIRYNHLALVDVARAGKDASLKLDGEQVDESEALETAHKGQNRFDGATNMKKITIDGVEYEVQPQVAVALEKANTRADSAEAAAKASKTAEDSAKAKMDQAIEDGKKVAAESAKKLDAAVNERVELVLVASDRLDAETVKGIAEMDNQAIRLAVIKAANPNSKFDGKDSEGKPLSADYIRSRFDAVLDSDSDTALAGQRREMHGDSKTREDAAAEDPTKARAEMKKRMDSAPADYLKRKAEERKSRGR